MTSNPVPASCAFWQLGLLVLVCSWFWDAMTRPGLIPPFMFDNDRQAAFFFGEPLKVAERIWAWFVPTPTSTATWR
jgi:NitT/TauT family transport system permease protein